MGIELWLWGIILLIQGFIDGSLWIEYFQGTWFIGFMILIFLSPIYFVFGFIVLVYLLWKIHRIRKSRSTED